MKFSSRYPADLCATPLGIRNNSVADNPSFSVPESGAIESMEPYMIMQMLRATFFRRKPFLKSSQRRSWYCLDIHESQVRGTNIIFMN